MKLNLFILPLIVFCNIVLAASQPLQLSKGETWVYKDSAYEAPSGIIQKCSIVSILLKDTLRSSDTTKFIFSIRDSGIHNNPNQPNDTLVSDTCIKIGDSFFNTTSNLVFYNGSSSGYDEVRTYQRGDTTYTIQILSGFYYSDWVVSNQFVGFVYEKSWSYYHVGELTSYITLKSHNGKPFILPDFATRVYTFQPLSPLKRCRAISKYLSIGKTGSTVSRLIQINGRNSYSHIATGIYINHNTEK